MFTPVLYKESTTRQAAFSSVDKASNRVSNKPDQILRLRESGDMREHKERRRSPLIGESDEELSSRSALSRDLSHDDRVRPQGCVATGCANQHEASVCIHAWLETLSSQMFDKREPLKAVVRQSDGISTPTSPQYVRGSQRFFLDKLMEIKMDLAELSNNVPSVVNTLEEVRSHNSTSDQTRPAATTECLETRPEAHSEYLETRSDATIECLETRPEAHSGYLETRPVATIECLKTGPEAATLTVPWKIVVTSMLIGLVVGISMAFVGLVLLGESAVERPTAVHLISMAPGE